MKVSVFGMGYVGCVSACCLARAGHRVIGVERNAEKVSILRSGRLPFLEPGLPEIAAEQVAAGRLTVTTDPAEGVLGSDISLVCVGTPSLPSGIVDLASIEAVCNQIAAALAAKQTRHLIVVRSTVPPGTIERCIERMQQAAGRQCPADFGILSNPEFLREGSAVADFDAPPFTVIGAQEVGDAQRVAELYSQLDAPMLLTDLPTAQMIKYACNLFHATKIVFGNEIGRICKAFGVDSHAVMDFVCRDTKLNISPCYLRPGFAFGGSCLPKDLRAILALARERHVELPMLEGIMHSNRQQVALGLAEVLATGKQRIGMLGLSFKPNTDDLRESPHVAILETLIGKGKDVRVYDPNIVHSRLIGANRAFIDEAIPHLVKLMADSEQEILDNCDCLIIGNRDPQYRDVLTRLQPRHVVVDLVRIDQQCRTGDGYVGLSW